MRQVRYILVITMVATVCCANDEVLSIGRDARLSRAVNNETGSSLIVGRLSASLGRSVAPVRLIASRLHIGEQSSPTPLFAIVPVSPAHCPISPFQFRLPPPLA